MNLLRIIASRLYGLVVGIRNLLYDEHILHSESVSVPTICIGNLAAGGTGKTPHTECVVGMLAEKGYKVAILSRGYKRKTKGFILADAQSTADSIGDEPMQMHLHFPNIPIAVSENRVRGVKRLQKLYPDLQVVVLDDAFQHRRLRCGYYILLTAADNLYVHDHLLPWGSLREQRYGSLRANMVIVSKCPRNMRPIDKRVIDSTLHLPTYQYLLFSEMKYGNLRPLFDEMADAVPNKPLVVTGIANPSYMQEYLKSRYKEIATFERSDHYRYTERDINEIAEQCQREHCDGIITTEKDAVRLQMIPRLREILGDKIYVLPIQTAITEGEDIFTKQIINYVTENNRNR